MSNTEWRIKYEPVRSIYLIFADGKEIGRAPDIEGVIDFIQNMQKACEYSSNFCDNESSGTTAESAAQKSQ